jgi:hypothetical protein
MVSLIAEAADSGHRAGVFSAVSQMKTLLTAMFFPLLGYLCDTYGVLSGMLAFSMLHIIIIIPFLHIRN